MITRRLLLILIHAFIVTTSYSQERGRMAGRSELTQKASWMIGNWELSFPGGRVEEKWEKQNDTLFNGISYFIQGKDTMSSESVQLFKSGNDIFYVPSVSNQNHGKPVPFKLTNSTENQLIFENPEHDFPQKISYTFVSPDSLKAVVSGIVNGQEQMEKFPMKRVK